MKSLKNQEKREKWLKKSKIIQEKKSKNCQANNLHIWKDLFMVCVCKEASGTKSVCYWSSPPSWKDAIIYLVSNFLVIGTPGE